MSDIITIQNFSKHFGPLQVIHDLNFVVESAEIFAFLGANGSGKTTTIRSLLGIYEPDQGELLINGQRYDQTMSSLLGYLPEERGLYLDSRVIDVMAYFGELKGMRHADAVEWSKQYLERVDLADKWKEKVKKLSSGQQQKIQLGITLINQPQLLILDEPTKGLDPVNRALFMEIFRDMNKAYGTTIVFSTHMMEEAEKIANRLVMIKDGQRALYGPVREVKAQFGDNVVQLEFGGTLEVQPKLFNVLRQEANYAEIEMVDNVQTNEVIEYLLKSGLKIRRFEQTTPSLQEIFIMVSKQHAE